VWRSPVARLLWEQDVGGSNPLTPIFLLEQFFFRCISAFETRSALIEIPWRFDEPE
jgi:hypothetical protein